MIYNEENLNNRGKITRQEFHEKLINELNTYSRNVISSTEPTENLVNGLIWFNPEENNAKIYYRNGFENFSSGIGGTNSSGNVATGASKVKTNRVTLTTKTNKATIGISDFTTSTGYLMIIINGVTLYPEDFTFSEDEKQIIKSNGNWNEHGGKTDILFMYLMNKNDIVEVTKTVRPSRKESLYICTGLEPDGIININIPNYRHYGAELEVYYNGIAIYEDYNYTVSENEKEIIIPWEIKKNDEIFFRTWLTRGTDLG